MVTLNTCTYLIGSSISEIHIKTFDELDEIGEKMGNSFLLWQIFMSRLSLHFWMREYTDVAELSETYSKKHPSSPRNRVLNLYRTFFEGIAYFSLARDTKQANWKVLGKKAMAYLCRLESQTQTNFENKSQLLHAELCYLEGNLELADFFYNNSIQSAHELELVHEEALACERYGVFCVENQNQMIDKGLKQLRLALAKYKQWGAMKKVDELQLFIDLVDQAYFVRKARGEHIFPAPRK